MNPLDDFYNQPFDNYDKIIIIRLEQQDEANAKLMLRNFLFKIYKFFKKKFEKREKKTKKEYKKNLKNNGKNLKLKARKLDEACWITVV